MGHRGRRKSGQRQKTNDNIRRDRSRKLASTFDIVTKSNPSPPRVGGLLSLLSRKIINTLQFSYFIAYSF